MSQRVVNWAEKNWTSIVGAVLTVMCPALGVIWDAAVGYYYGGLKGLAIGAASAIVANVVVGYINVKVCDFYAVPTQGSGLAGLARATAVGYASGAASGAISAKLSGQNVWEGARAGGLSGGIFSAGLDVYYDHENIANDMAKLYKEAHEAISEWWHSVTGPNTLASESPKAASVGVRPTSSPQKLPDYMSDPKVRAAIEQAWDDSNPYSPSVPNGQLGSLKQEQGGWIVKNHWWDFSDDEYTVVRIQGGTRDSLDFAGTRPDGDVVGCFHTHPNFASEGYIPEVASPGDISMTNNYAKVTQVIRTPGGIVVVPYGGKP